MGKSHQNFVFASFVARCFTIFLTTTRSFELFRLGPLVGPLLRLFLLCCSCLFFFSLIIFLFQASSKVEQHPSVDGFKKMQGDARRTPLGTPTSGESLRTRLQGLSLPSPDIVRLWAPQFATCELRGVHPRTATDDVAVVASSASKKKKTPNNRCSNQEARAEAATRLCSSASSHPAPEAPFRRPITRNT